LYKSMIKNPNVRRVFPKWLKQPLKQALGNRQLRHAIRKLRKSRTDVPSRELLSELITAWGNESYSASLDYLEAVARLSVDAGGPIIECGTGVTTILLAILSERRNIGVWSLEHSVEWQTRIAQVLAKNGIAPARICLSPLIEYGEFVWYEPPLAQLPDEFSLVICDGPPGSTKGGRYGLLPVLGDRLPAGSTILLDDAGRPGELQVIKRWEQEVGFETELTGTSTRQFAVMRRLN
jgi:hypothetical protein